jgi:hypothetical protein
MPWRHIGEWRYSSMHSLTLVLNGGGSQDSSVSIATGCRLDNLMIGIQFPAGAGNLSLWHHVQTGSRVCPASYPIGTRVSFPGSKAAGAWSWPLISFECQGKRMHGAIPPLPQYVFMVWYWVKHRDNFTFTFTFTKWRWMVSFTPQPLYPQGRSPWYPLNRRLDVPQSHSGHSVEEKNSQSWLGSEPWSSSWQENQIYAHITLPERRIESWHKDRS